MGILRGLCKWSPAVMAMALFVPLITAQEGHPLKGSWIGVWQGNTVLGNDILMILNWDGKAVGGTINPGTDNLKVEKAALDPACNPQDAKAACGWKVHLEAEAKDKSGKASRYVIDGAIQQLEMPNRSIVGTWSNGSAKGKFEVHRQ